MNEHGYYITNRQDPYFQEQECPCPDCIDGRYQHFDATLGEWTVRVCATCEGTGIVFRSNFGRLA